MNGDAQLTVCFGERSRTPKGLLADELLDIYGRHRIRASALLRGTQGFGAKHRLRSDRLLTLSEDLPLMAIAVDRRERIDAVAEEAMPLIDAGLLTLEPLRIATHGSVAGEMDMMLGETNEHDGEALALTAYVGRYERADGRPAFAAVCQMLHERGVAGATVLLGVDGTKHGRRRRARFVGRNVHVPTLVLAVGRRQSIESTLDELQTLVPTALLTLKRVCVCKRDGLLLARPHERPPLPQPSAAMRPMGETEGEAQALQRLTVVTSEAATHDGRPVHLELVRRLRAAGAAGATSLRGIWGFHGAHEPHGDRLLSIRRHVPVVTIVVDSPQRVAQLFAIVDELTRERGLVTSELLPANMALSTRL